MNEVAEEVQVEQPTVTERPEWLAEKFNTPEDLASAYSCLLYTSPSPRDP